MILIIGLKIGVFTLVVYVTINKNQDGMVLVPYLKLIVVTISCACGSR